MTASFTVLVNSVVLVPLVLLSVAGVCQTQSFLSCLLGDHQICVSSFLWPHCEHLNTLTSVALPRRCPSMGRCTPDSRHLDLLRSFRTRHQVLRIVPGGCDLQRLVVPTSGFPQRVHCRLAKTRCGVFASIRLSVFSPW